MTEHALRQHESEILAKNFPSTDSETEVNPGMNVEPVFCECGHQQRAHTDGIGPCQEMLGRGADGQCGCQAFTPPMDLPLESEDMTG